MKLQKAARGSSLPSSLSTLKWGLNPKPQQFFFPFRLAEFLQQTVCGLSFQYLQLPVSTLQKPIALFNITLNIVLFYNIIFHTKEYKWHA